MRYFYTSLSRAISCIFCYRCSGGVTSMCIPTILLKLVNSVPSSFLYLRWYWVIYTPTLFTAVNSNIIFPISSSLALMGVPIIFIFALGNIGLSENLYCSQVTTRKQLSLRIKAFLYIFLKAIKFVSFSF